MFIITVYLCFSIIAVLWFDITRYIIPNWLVGSLLALYPVAVAMTHQAVDWKMALAGMGIVLVIGFAIFSMKWMGGGDIKLLSACALWVGWQHLLEYLFAVTLLGGAFSVGLLIARKWVAPYLQKEKPLPRILKDREPVPYGVAISLAFLMMIWRGYIAAIL